MSSFEPGQGSGGSGCLWPALVAVVLVAGGVGLLVYLNRPKADLDAVAAASGQLTLEEDDGKNLTAVGRSSRPELWYRVTLAKAPVGFKIDLACDWIDPAGKVVHRNRYQTRSIDRADWPTHARYQLGADAPLGPWMVRLSLEGRVLHSMKFAVRDGAKHDSEALGDKGP